MKKKEKNIKMDIPKTEKIDIKEKKVYKAKVRVFTSDGIKEIGEELYLPEDEVKLMVEQKLAE